LVEHGIPIRAREREISRLSLLTTRKSMLLSRRATKNLPTASISHHRSRTAALSGRLNLCTRVARRCTFEDGKARTMHQLHNGAGQQLAFDNRELAAVLAGLRL
jgi:hypothetical protein